MTSTLVGVNPSILDLKFGFLSHFSSCKFIDKKVLLYVSIIVVVLRRNISLMKSKLNRGFDFIRRSLSRGDTWTLPRWTIFVRWTHEYTGSKVET